MTSTAMHLEFLVEEPSAEAVLKALVPKILESLGAQSTSFNIRVFQGKPDLLKKLPKRLRAYRKYTPPPRIVVLLDADEEDCKALKARMDQIASEAGMTTPATSPQGFQVLNRLAVEELEAWFFGDAAALRAAYPRVSPTLEKQKRYRDPDAIKHTWEALEGVLQQADYHRGGLEKIRAAREIAQHMAPQNNRSPSFQAFYRGVGRILQPPR